MNESIDLSDLIWQLRHDLTRAMWAGESTDIKFYADSIELELSIAVEKSTDPSVKVRFFVVDGQYAAKRSETSTQRIKLSLRPFLPGHPAEPATITGPSLDDEM